MRAGQQIMFSDIITLSFVSTSGDRNTAASSDIKTLLCPLPLYSDSCDKRKLHKRQTFMMDIEVLFLVYLQMLSLDISREPSL